MQLEAAHHRADTLASRNLAVLLSHLALRKLLHISTLFSLLDHLCSRSAHAVPLCALKLLWLCKRLTASQGAFPKFEPNGAQLLHLDT